MLLIVVYVLGVLLTIAYVIVVGTKVISVAAVPVKSQLHHVRLR